MERFEVTDIEPTTEENRRGIISKPGWVTARLIVSAVIALIAAGLVYFLAEILLPWWSAHIAVGALAGLAAHEHTNLNWKGALGVGIAAGIGSLIVFGFIVAWWAPYLAIIGMVGYEIYRSWDEITKIFMEAYNGQTD